MIINVRSDYVKIGQNKSYKEVMKLKKKIHLLFLLLSESRLGSVAFNYI